MVSKYRSAPPTDNLQNVCVFVFTHTHMHRHHSLKNHKSMIFVFLTVHFVTDFYAVLIDVA